MINIVLLSHSSKIVEGVKEFIKEMAGEAEIFAVGGTNDGRLGADYDRIKTCLEEAYNEDGTLIFFDLGSTLMTVGMVLDEMEPDRRKKYYLMDAPLVEASIMAAIQVSSNTTPEDIQADLAQMKLNKI